MSSRTLVRAVSPALALCYAACHLIGHEDDMINRIGIIGAGAIGSVVGGMLTRAGRDVTLIDQWPEHVESMRKIGLRLSGTCGEHLVPVKALHIHELQSVTEPFEAVFLSVKS